ncbi:MAG: hypothetical protein ACI9XO_000234, partial [Paraglaciecola sp.]
PLLRLLLGWLISLLLSIFVFPYPKLHFLSCNFVWLIRGLIQYNPLEVNGDIPEEFYQILYRKI